MLVQLQLGIGCGRLWLKINYKSEPGAATLGRPTFEWHFWAYAGVCNIILIDQAQNDYPVSKYPPVHAAVRMHGLVGQSSAYLNELEQPKD
jgi:hypothetical protein